MKDYSGHLLCSGKGADPKFISGAMPVRPGTAFPPQQTSAEDIFLAGGFPGIHPDSTFPLSPTLQLNGDLAHFSDTEMAALARAEFIRSNSQSYRSYTLDPNPRVAVLGGDTESLRTFCDNYGGLLQIDPLLIQGYTPEFATAEELEISKNQDGYRVSFTVKQPVDLSRCTYCDSCGPVCPEHCLSEQLFLDFSRCTLCKECVSICPHGAIDLHTVERRELLTPAILLLAGVKVDLPQQQEKIYSEKDIPRLFASVYSIQVDEVITWSSSFCQYSSKLGIGCSNCLNSCSHGAVQQDQDGVHIDHLACLECGSCLADCPTGALQYKRFDDTRFVEYFRTFPLAPGTTVVLGREQDLHRYWWQSRNTQQENIFFLEYPQPHALHALHFLFLYGMGAKRIFTIGKESSNTGRQVQLVNTLLQSLFATREPLRMIQAEQLPDCLAAEEERSSSLTDFYHDFSFTNRREKLIDLIRFLMAQSRVDPAQIPTIATDDFAEILCDEDTCTHCSACVNECRVEALTADADSFSLRHSPALCVQCGICVTVCPENALTPQAGLSLRADFFTEKTVAQAEPLQCLACGKVFGTRKSLEKVVAILTAKNMWDSQDDLLSYCDTCRVVNLYESQAK